MTEQQEVKVEDLINAYNNNLAELDKLKKMIDKMAMNEARHTVEIAERDVVIDNLRAMITQAGATDSELNVSEEE